MSASTASHSRDAQSPGSTSVLQPGQTLRALLDELRTHRQNLRLDDAIAIIVPLCLDLKARHDRRERVYVHPSCVVGGPDGLARIDSTRALVPTNPLDRACTAPELQQSLEPGNARASVFSIGALLYEAVTGAHVGPGMRRPRDIDPNLPDALEILMAKALVANPAHRPEDLGALASAMHTLAPKKSMLPPSADVSRLDGTAEFEVDIRLSMLPMEETMPDPPLHIPRSPGAPRITNSGGDPFGGVIEVPTGPRQRLSDPTATLSALKARLESDPRPRYVVNKDHMDHGPFSAVELLQQMASNQFVGTDVLRDELSGQQRPIGEWEEFAPFAVQTALKRDSLAEKKAVAQVERKEKSAGIAKSLIGLIVIVALGAGAALWFFQFRGSRNDDRDVADDPNASDIDIQGGVKGQGRGGGKGGRGRGAGGGGFPSGMSYEAAIGANVQTVEMGAKTVPDLTDGQLSAPMKSASFIDGCGAPSSMHVMVKVAIKNGRAVGVSVYPTPPDARVASCVASAVRNISWPPNPKMDSFTTTY
jgi:hypothetical protein